MSSQRRQRPGDGTGRAGLTRVTQPARTASPASAVPSSYDRKEVVQALDGLVTVISEDEVTLNTLADGVTELLKHRDPRGGKGGHDARLAVITQVIDKVFLEDSILQLVGTQLSRELKGAKRKAAQDPSEPKDRPTSPTVSKLPADAGQDSAPLPSPPREAEAPAPPARVEPSVTCADAAPAVQEEEEVEEGLKSVASTVELCAAIEEEAPRDSVQIQSVEVVREVEAPLKANKEEVVTGAGRVEGVTHDELCREDHAKGGVMELGVEQEGRKAREEEDEREEVFVTPKTHEDPPPTAGPPAEGPSSEAPRMEEITSEDEEGGEDECDGSTISNVSSEGSLGAGLAPGESVFSRGFNPGELLGPGGPGFSSRATGSGAAVAAKKRLAPFLGLGERSDSLVELGGEGEGGEDEGLNLSLSGGEGECRQREEGLDTSLGQSSGSNRSSASGKSSVSGKSLGTDEEGGGRRGLVRGNRRRGGDGAHHRRCTSSVSSVLTVDSLNDLMMDLLPPNAEDTSSAHQFAPHAMLSPSRFKPVLATLHSMDVPSEEDDSGSDVQTVGLEKGEKKGSCLGHGQGSRDEDSEYFDASDEMDKQAALGGKKAAAGGKEEEEEEEEEEDEYEDDYDEYEESEDAALREHRLPSPKPWDRIPTKVRFVPRVVTEIHYIEPYAPEDLHLLFYSEREIRLFEMEAEGPLPSSDDEESEDGGRKLSSHITSGGARVETVVFDDAASDDFWA